MTTRCDLTARIQHRLLDRNSIFESFFARESTRLATACREMSERFLHGGRLLAFGRGPYATDAQHVSVEFIHPIIVGKRALPALDLSPAFSRWLPAIVGDADIVMGFSEPAGDDAVDDALAQARTLHAYTFALPGRRGDFALNAPSH